MTSDAKKVKLEQQLKLEKACKVHNENCTNSRCFVRDGITPKFYYNPPILDFDMDIVDSYQEGHGLHFEVKCKYRQSTVISGDRTYACNATHRGSTIKVRCCCKKPTPHKSLVDAACTMYNLQ